MLAMHVPNSTIHTFSPFLVHFFTFSFFPPVKKKGLVRF